MPGGRGVRLRVAVAASVGLVALLLGACGGGGGGTGNPNIIEAGQVNIQLPDGYQLTKPGDQAAAAPSSAPAAAGDGESAAPPAADPAAAVDPSAATTAAPADTIPLAQQDPTTKFFSAFGQFRSCLKNQGLTFLGVPDPNKPNSPTNDPAYIKGLQTCAAQSNILQALQELQNSQNNLTPDQIEEQNKSYLVWRDCMIDHGWKIPEPVPDSKGRLLSFGPNAPQIEGPAGEDLFDSNDFQECASQAQQETGASGGG